MRQLLRSPRRLYIRRDQCLPEVLKPTSRLSCDCSHIVYPSILPSVQVGRYRKVLSAVREGQNYGQSDYESGPTIYALSTAPGRAAIAIVRISGPRCVEVRNISSTDVQLAK